MFDIYIKDFNQNGQLITEETLVQTIPADKAGDLKLTSPLVKTDLGNAESFTFGIEGGTKFYDAFNQMKTFMRVVYDGDTIFYGRVLTIDNGFFGTRSLRCEGPLAFLNDSSIEGIKEESRPEKTINDYFQQLIDNHNSQLNDSRRSFTFGEIPGLYTNAVSEAQQVVKNADVESKKRKYGSDSWSDTKGLVEDLRSHYGGYLRVRCPGYQNGNHYVDQGHIIDWMNHYFSTGEISQTVEVGKNIIDISSSTEVDNIFTVVIPIGNTKTKTSETVDGEKKSTTPKHFYVDGKEVTVPSICAKYGRELNSGYHTYDDYASALDRYGRIIKTVVFDDAENATQLLEKCQEWIKNNYQGEVTKFTVKAVDMHQIGDKSVSKIRVGDQVRLIYPVIKEDDTVEKRSIVRTCLSISYDLYNPENNSYTFGIPANILTKSYGVLKQAGNKDSASKPKSSGSSGSSKTRDWISQVTEWLADHKINYKHLSDGETLDTRVWPDAHFPYDGTKQYEKGPFGDHRDYFYDVEYALGIGRFTVWKFTPIGDGEEFDQDELDKILQQVRDGMKGCPETAIQEARRYAERAYRNSHTYTKWDRQLVTLNGVLSVQNVVECKIVEYVKQEYGVDLQTFNNVKMPEVSFTDSDGVTQNYVPAEGSKIITKEMFKSDYSGEVPEGWHVINRTDTYVDPITGEKKTVIRQIGSCQDDKGNWTYYIEDPDNPGVIIPTTIRDLTFESIESSTFRGTMVSEKYADENGHIHIYKFGQEIEKWADGELVVARMDGDIVQIGSAERTSQIVEGALNNVSSVCGNFEVEVDQTTGERRVILHEGSGIFKRRDGIEMGLYDEGNLTAGILVEKINGETTARIVGDHIVIGQRKDGSISKDITLMATDSTTIGLFNVDSSGNAVMEAGTKIYRTKDGVTSAFGIWDSSGQEVQGGLVVEKINDQTTTYLRGDRIVVGNAQTNKSVMDALKTAGVITSDTLEPQALVAKAVYTNKINAIEGRIGTLEVNDLETAKLRSKISLLGDYAQVDYFQVKDRLSLLSGMELTWNSTTPSTTNKITVSDFEKIPKSIAVDASTSVATFNQINSKKFTISISGNNLIFKDADNNQMSFSKATSLSGEWGGTNDYFPHIVRATPQNVTYSIGFGTTNQSLNLFVRSSTTRSPEASGTKTLKVPYRIVSWHSGTPPTEITRYDSDYLYPDATSIYNNGWDAARDNISYPGTAPSGESVNFSFKVPNATRDGQDTVQYTMKKGTPSTSGYASVSDAGSHVVARISIGNWYTSGWSAACAQLSIPTAANAGQKNLVIGYPSSTPDGGQWTQTYTLDEDGKNAVRLYTTVTISGATQQRNVAYISHNKYNSGWSAAYSKVSVPSTSSYGDSMSVSTPPSTVDGDASTIQFDLSVDDNYAYIKNHSNAMVFARVTNTKSSGNASKIDLGDYRASTNKPSDIDTYVDMATLANLIRNNHQTYIWIKATITGGTGVKWYRLATPN